MPFVALSSPTPKLCGAIVNQTVDDLRGDDVRGGHHRDTLLVDTSVAVGCVGSIELIAEMKIPSE